MKGEGPAMVDSENGQDQVATNQKGDGHNGIHK